MQRLVLSVLLVLTAPAGAQTTNPLRYTWIADACESWNCAAAALVLANGQPGLIILPTGVEQPLGRSAPRPGGLDLRS